MSQAREERRRAPLIASGNVPPYAGGVAATASRLMVQVFPLAANRARLQQFCDVWFNAHVPPTVAYFKPAMPAVFCSVLHYREMGDELLWRTGALSQNEVYFIVMLDRYRRTSRGLEFIEHCFTTPYIFVDNPMSAIAGRERYGYPKQACEFTRDWPERRAPPWAADARHYLTVSAWDPTPLGHTRRTLMHIVHEPSRWRGPGPDLTEAPVVTPRGSLDRTDYAWLLGATWNEIRARMDPGLVADYAGWFQEIRRDVRDGGPFVNLYNMRQFPHPIRPAFCRYRDLVRFRMRLRATPQDFGFVGEQFGPSSAFSLLLHRTAVRPIAERLGLRVASQQQGAGPDAPVVDIIRIVAPWYAQADVELVSAERTCWKFQEGPCNADEGELAEGDRYRGWSHYNDYLGASAAVFLEKHPAEPVQDVRLWMLGASTAAAQRYLDERMPPRCDVRIEPLDVQGRTCIRLLFSRAQRPLDEEELVWHDGDYLSLSLPIRFAREGAGYREGLLLLQDFTENQFLLQSLRAIAATPTLSAVFDTGGDEAMSTPRRYRRILELRTMTMERSAMQARHELSPFCEVYDMGTAFRDTERHRRPRQIARRDVLWDHIRGPRPILSFGSIPDPSDPNGHVTRRLMLTEVTEREVMQTSTNDAAHVIRFHDSETFSFVSQFGVMELHAGDVARAQLPAVKGRTHLVPAWASEQHTLRLKRAVAKILWHEIVPRGNR